MSRPSPAHATAAILNLFVAIAGIVFTLPPITQGAAASNASGEQPPFVIVVLAFVLGVIGFVSSWGVWRQQRWGVVLTIVVNALSFLSGAPGIAFGPTTFLVVGSVVGCLLNVTIVYLLLRRRPAPVVEPAH